MRDRERYEVGYAKPPAHTRFKAGHSGNPTGRPKRSKRFDSILETEFDTIIGLTIDGKPRSITKREAMIRHLFAKALRGDSRAAEMFLQHMRKRDAEDRQLPYIIKYYKDPAERLSTPTTEGDSLAEVSGVDGERRLS